MPFTDAEIDARLALRAKQREAKMLDQSVTKSLSGDVTAATSGRAAETTESHSIPQQHQHQRSEMMSDRVHGQIFAPADITIVSPLPGSSVSVADVELVVQISKRYFYCFSMLYNIIEHD